MNPQDFCYWLQGKLEGRDLAAHPLTEWEQVSIQDHLKLVFNKVTPPNDGKTYPVVPMIDWSKTIPQQPFRVSDFPQPIRFIC